MANSIQELRGKRLSLNDHDLIALMALALHAIDKLPLERFQELAGLWKQQLVGYGPGVIDLCLDALLNTPAQRESFNQLIDLITREVQVYGAEVPASKMNTLGLPDGVRFGDYQTCNIHNSIARIQKLIDGT